MKHIALFMIVVLIITSCAPSNQSIQEAIQKTVNAVGPTNQTQPTTKIQSTSTTPPTSTSVPSKTPAPTKTTAPTNTPTIAPSPTQPPQPIELSGNGQQVIEFDNPFGPAFIHAVYTAGRYITIKNFDADNENIDLLVNTPGNYDGYRPIDIDPDEHTMRFTVKTEGDWKMTVYPLVLEYTHICEIPCEYSGTGDDVILLVGATPDTIDYDFPGDGPAILIGHYEDTYDLLQNSMGPAKGTALMPKGVYLLEIRATEPWAIKIKER